MKMLSIASAARRASIAGARVLSLLALLSLLAMCGTTTPKNENLGTATSALTGSCGDVTVRAWVPCAFAARGFHFLHETRGGMVG